MPFPRPPARTWALITASSPPARISQTRVCIFRSAYQSPLQSSPPRRQWSQHHPWVRQCHTEAAVSHANLRADPAHGGGAIVPSRAATQTYTRGSRAISSAAERSASMVCPAMCEQYASISMQVGVRGLKLAEEQRTTAARRALASGRARAILYMASGQQTHSVERVRGGAGEEGRGASSAGLLCCPLGACAATRLMRRCLACRCRQFPGSLTGSLKKSRPGTLISSTQALNFERTEKSRSSHVHAKYRRRRHCKQTQSCRGKRPEFLGGAVQIETRRGIYSFDY